MKSLYYKTPQTREDEPSVKALSEKVQRLEKALDEKPEGRLIVSTYTKQLEAKVIELSDIISKGQEKPNLGEQLRARNFKLGEQVHKMRNCINCNQWYCGKTENGVAATDCLDNGHFHWELADAPD